MDLLIAQNQRCVVNVGKSFDDALAYVLRVYWLNLHKALSVAFDKYSDTVKNLSSSSPRVSLTKLCSSSSWASPG